MSVGDFAGHSAAQFEVQKSMCAQHVGSHLQVEVHAHFRNARVREFAKANNIHVTAYSPLSSPANVKDMGMDMPNLMEVCNTLLCAIVT